MTDASNVPKCNRVWVTKIFWVKGKSEFAIRIWMPLSRVPHSRRKDNDASEREQPQTLERSRSPKLYGGQCGIHRDHLPKLRAMQPLSG